MVEISVIKGYLYYCFSFFLFIYSNNCNHGISPSDISLNEVHTIKYRSWTVPLLFLSKEVPKIGMINPSIKSVMNKILGDVYIWTDRGHDPKTYFCMQDMEN